MSACFKKDILVVNPFIIRPLFFLICRSIYNIIEANHQGAHIVTVSETVLSRLHWLNQTPNDASIEAVNIFRNDEMIQFL